MDVALLLLLPLVGGYYFATWSNFCRYRSAREEGHRLYFRAAFYGSILFVFAIFIRACLLELELYRHFEATISYWTLQLVKDPDKPHQFPLAILSFYAMVLGPVVGWLSNLIFWQRVWLDKALKYSDFERVIQRSWKHRFPICLSMDNGKVYVGFVVTTTDPTKDRKSVGILPIISGYRNDEGKITFTTDYRRVYDTLNDDLEDDLTPTDFEIALPADRIHSCNIFDFRAYELFTAEGKPRQRLVPWGHRPRNKSWARG